MSLLPRFFLAIGCLLLLFAFVLKITGIPFMFVLGGVKPSSLLVLANTSLILAVLLKK